MGSIVHHGFSLLYYALRVCREIVLIFRLE